MVNGQWQPAKPAPSANAIETPPLHRPNRRNSPPPESDRELLFTKEGNYQEPASCGRAGVFKRAGSSDAEASPNIRNVKLSDLKDTGRLLLLFEDAAKGGLVARTDLDRHRFLGAAEHACAAGKSNPCGLFVWLVRNKRWHHITEREDHFAQVKVKMFVRNEEMPAFRRSPTPAPLSPDAKFAKSLLSVLRQKRVLQDPYPELSRMRPEWTRERWQRAMTELRDSAHLGANGSGRGFVRLSGRASTPEQCLLSFAFCALIPVGRDG